MHKIHEIFDHLKKAYQDKKLSSEQYDLDYQLFLDETRKFSENFDKNPDAFFLACQDFLRHHNELRPR